MTTDTCPPSTEPAPQSILEGCDVSYWSGNLDYDGIARDMVFLYHQATDGVGTVDGKILERTNALRSVGMGDVLGAYHFLRVRHGRAQDAKEQCKEFLDIRAKAGCMLPPWLDVELGEKNSSNRAATHDEVRAAVEDFWEQYEVETTSPSTELPLYTSPGEAQAMGIILIPNVGLRPLALAEYNGGAPPALPAPVLAVWPIDKILFHQYQGNAFAYHGVIDRTRYFGTLDGLKSR